MRETTEPADRSVQHVEAREGRRSERVLSCASRSTDLARVPTIADLVAVTEIMTRSMRCARSDLDAARAAELMVRNHIGCVPVVDDHGRPVGMITKLDVVEQATAPPNDDLAPRTADELMMPLAITLDERATIAHAAAMMAAEDIHHVPIVDAAGRLIGIVSSMDIVRWLARNDGFTV